MKEQRRKGAKEQRNEGTNEQRNKGTSALSLLRPWADLARLIISYHEVKRFLEMPKPPTGRIQFGKTVVVSLEIFNER